MKVITLVRTKELLGITDTASDDDINAKIPFIDATVKRITNNRYNLKVFGNATSGSPYIALSGIQITDTTSWTFSQSTRNFVSGINNFDKVDDLSEFIEIGQLIEGTGIPADTHIEEVFYNGTAFNDGTDDFTLPTIKLSNNATATSEDGFIFIGINIAYQKTIADGIQFLINKTSTKLPSNSLASRVIGPSNKSFSSKAQNQEGKNGMPAWFNTAFPRFQGGH